MIGDLIGLKPIRSLRLIFVDFNQFTAYSVSIGANLTQSIMRH